MLQTPASFTPLIQAQTHDDPLTFIFHGQRLLLQKETLALPASSGLTLDPVRIHPLGLWQGRYCQVAWTDQEALPDPAQDWHSLRALFGQVDEEFVGIAARASQIAEWARTHRFCGACGTPMAKADGERAFKCPSCAMVAYPRISPAMMVLIRKGEQVLLASHAQGPTQRFTALAGFLEAGESVEEAVHREVFEEVGLKVHNLQYFKSQSWPFPHSLMIAFTADYLSGEIRVDPQEIAEARWFGPDDEWPGTPVTVSVASELIGAFRPQPRAR
jgi:NAD+ diphosphatase